MAEGSIFKNLENEEANNKFVENLLKDVPVFVGSEDKVFYMADIIQPFDRYLCVSQWTSNPFDFYVALYHRQTELEIFKKTLQNYTVELVKRLGEEYRHKSNEIEKGLYVMARYINDEWHRGRIIKRIPDGRYAVVLIDNGEIVLFIRDRIRPMVKYFLDAFEAQAIHCQIADRSGIWKSVVERKNSAGAEVEAGVKIFKKLMKKVYYSGKFWEIAPKKEIAVNDTTWIVNLEICDEDLMLIYEPDVEKRLLKLWQEGREDEDI